MARLAAPALALVLAAGGCSLIVSGEVTDFQCSPGSDTSACPSGMACNASGLCVSGEASIDPIEAGDEEIPDEDAGDSGKDAETSTGPQELGTQCRVDAECKSRLCGSSTILTSTITQTTGPICTTPCCTSGECAPSFVCFNGGTGGGYCVPAKLAQRTPPASGGKTGGVNCAVSTECRSGLCDKPDGGQGRCLDTCCSAGECGGTSTCRLKGVSAPGPSHDVWVCAQPEPGAVKIAGEQCSVNGDCASDNCIGISGPSRICRPPCSNTASCKAVAGFTNGHCLYGSSPPSDYFKFCFSGTTAGDSPAGAACTDDSTCQSDYCDGDLKKCANVCARDSDCAASEACRPSAANTPYLRCVAKP
jgi:hypothetical protein